MEKKMKLNKPKRNYLKDDFIPDNFDKIKLYYDELIDRQINSREELLKWIYDLSELYAAISEEAEKRYIAMTCDTEDKEKVDAFNFYMNLKNKGEI